MTDFMTALRVTFVQPTCPGEQRAVSRLSHYTADLPYNTVVKSVVETGVKVHAGGRWDRGFADHVIHGDLSNIGGELVLHCGNFG